MIVSSDGVHRSLGGQQLELHGETKAFRDLVAVLKRGLVAGEDADEMLDLLRRALGLSAIAMGHEWSYAGWHRTAGDLEAWIDVYEGQRLGQIDPSRPALLGAPYGSWYVAHFERDETFAALESVGQADVAITRLPSVRRSHMVLALYRESGAKLFDDDDLFLLDLIYPHLVTGLSTQMALEALDRPGESMAEFHERGIAVVQIGFPGPRIEWSSAARRLCNQALGPLGNVGMQRFERALLHAALQPSRAGTLPGPLRVEFAAMPPRPRDQMRLLAVLTPGRGDDAGGSAGEELLTPRERQVARCAARGLSASRVAHELGITTHTARVHLRNIYAKLGVHTRADLVRILG